MAILPIISIFALTASANFEMTEQDKSGFEKIASDAALDIISTHQESNCARDASGKWSSVSIECGPHFSYEAGTLEDVVFGIVQVSCSYLVKSGTSYDSCEKSSRKWRSTMTAKRHFLFDKGNWRPVSLIPIKELRAGCCNDVYARYYLSDDDGELNETSMSNGMLADQEFYAQKTISKSDLKRILKIPLFADTKRIFTIADKPDKWIVRTVKNCKPFCTSGEEFEVRKQDSQILSKSQWRGL